MFLLQILKRAGVDLHITFASCTSTHETEALAIGIAAKCGGKNCEWRKIPRIPGHKKMSGEKIFLLRRPFFFL